MNKNYEYLIKTDWYDNSTNIFIKKKMYLSNKINYSYRIPNFEICAFDKFMSINYSYRIPNFEICGFDGFTIIFLVYFSYMQNYTHLWEIKSMYNSCPLTQKLLNNVNLLEFIYLTGFNKLIGEQIKINKIILFLQDKLKENPDFNLYKLFYKNYFKYKVKSYTKININNLIIKKSNKLLGNKFYTLDMYNNLSNDNKKFLINLFYSIYINRHNYIDIHPIIFNYKMYLDFVKEIGKNKVLIN